MKQKTKKVFALIVLLFALTACGGTTSLSAPTQVPKTPTDTATATTAATVVPTATFTAIPRPIPTSIPTITGTIPLWGIQQKTSGCIAHQVLQDKACTPGDIIIAATQAIICVLGYTQTVHVVTDADKANVAKEYGVVTTNADEQQLVVEIDHLVPVELGGSNSYANLWPEYAVPLPGFLQKNIVEKYLQQQVCAGKMSLLQAQVAIATNWVSVWLALPPQYREP